MTARKSAEGCRDADRVAEQTLEQAKQQRKTDGLRVLWKVAADEMGKQV